LTESPKLEYIVVWPPIDRVKTLPGTNPVITENTNQGRERDRRKKGGAIGSKLKKPFGWPRGIM